MLCAPLLADGVGNIGDTVYPCMDDGELSR